MPTPHLGSAAFMLRDASRPLLILGPSLGTSVTALWKDVVPLLSSDFDIVGWDLPGHGVASAVEPGSLDGMSIADLAQAVLQIVEQAQSERGDIGAPFWYAGVSVGGAVGFSLLLNHRDRLSGAALICTAPKFGDPAQWLERATYVQAAGTPTQVIGSAQRWFSPGFIENPTKQEIALRLLGSLQEADRFGYAAVARALSQYDVTDQLDAIQTPLLVIQGADDAVSPPSGMEPVVAAVNANHPGLATMKVLDGVAHLAPAENPVATADNLRAFLTQGSAA